MKFTRNPLVHYAALTGIYLVLVLLLPANRLAMRTYSISAARYHLVLVAVVIPFIGIWFAAFYGYARLGKYAAAIRDSRDGSKFRLLARGSGWLAYALPLSAILSILLNAIANTRPNFHATAVVVNNYVSLVLPLIAFTLLSNGARQLSATSKLRLSLASGRALTLLFALLGVIYCYFTFRNINNVALSSADNSYYMPVWLAVVTVVMPYLYAWFIGLLAAYEIMLYARQVKGIIYRQALRYVGYGIAVVIISSIGIQYLSSVIPHTGTIHLNFVLLYIAGIEVLMAVGYSFTAIGARRLQRIEEV